MAHSCQKFEFAFLLYTILSVTDWFDYMTLSNDRALRHINDDDVYCVCPPKLKPQEQE